MLLTLRIRKVRWKIHFKTIEDGLKNTKGKLYELVEQIIATPNSDIKGVEVVIQGASAVIVKIIYSLSKLIGTIGDINIKDNHFLE
uniref:hypothetical protein n=1 Tax=Borrelia persica TaxID=44448 RepID=UPI000463549A|nr:hypothetical protein [Borrelia persica]